MSLSRNGHLNKKQEKAETCVQNSRHKKRGWVRVAKERESEREHYAEKDDEGNVTLWEIIAWVAVWSFVSEISAGKKNRTKHKLLSSHCCEKLRNAWWSVVDRGTAD